MPEFKPEQFLHEKDKDLHKSKFVEHEKERRKKKGEDTSEKPADKISYFMQILERTHLSHRDNPKAMERIESYYFKEYTIGDIEKKSKEELEELLKSIPQSYWNNKARIMINQGYKGDMMQGGVKERKEITESREERINYIFPEEMQVEELKVIASNQKKSLKVWLDYLTSEDATYPMWAKYFAFTSILKMGKLEKVEEDGVIKNRFQKRTETTLSPFPLLNPRALAKTIGVMERYLQEKHRVKEERQKPKNQRDKEKLKIDIENESSLLKDEEFLKLLSAEKFANLYAQFLLEIPEYQKEGLEITEGKWIKYNQNSDPKILVESLEGHPLEWCTADTETAKTQLQGGDFYVYYSYTKEDLNRIKEIERKQTNQEELTEEELKFISIIKPNIPRLAIRMEGSSKIAEPPRGIAPNQNLDPYICNVLEEKLKDFGREGELYKKRIKDMERLAEIENKKKKNEEISIEDLRFIYEIDNKIEGFGYQKDPRIDEILEKRNKKEDLSIIFNCKKEEISLTKEEALKGNIRYHYGSIDLGALTSAEGLKLPESIGGNLYLDGLTSAEGLTLPESIGGSLGLSALTSAEGLKLPESIGGSLYLSGLTSAEGLKLPESIGGSLGLNGLTFAEGLKLPESIGGNLYLGGLTFAEKEELIKKYPNLKII